MNKRNEDHINKSHPAIREKLTIGVNKADVVLTGVAKMIIVQSLRTFPEQHTLFLQRPRVTRADAGQSYHNYGLAIDFCLQIKGKDISWDVVKDWDGDGTPDWNEVVKIFEELGFKWGKSFNDMPHLEMSFGYNWRQLLQKYNAKEFITGTNYVKL